jgi:hypothetical protein
MKFIFFKRSELSFTHGAPGWVQQQAIAARFAAQVTPSNRVHVNVNVDVDVNVSGSRSHSPRTSSCSQR